MHNQHQKEKQTSIKLLNYYADSYHSLELELNKIKKENTDLKTNLKLNKEIIQSFFNCKTIEQKFSIYITKIKEEKNNYESQIKHLQTQIDNYRQKSSFISLYKEQNEEYKTKIFLLENLIKEKDNELKKYNKNSSKIFSKNQGGIYITSPSIAINKLHEQIQTIKEENKQLLSKIQSFKSVISKKNKTIDNNEKKIAKYKKEINEYRQMKNNTNIISQLMQYKLSFGLNSKNQSINMTSPSSNYTDFSCLNTPMSSNISKSRRNIINQIDKLERVNKAKKDIIKSTFDLSEEWNDTLKNCSLSQAEYVKYCENKQFAKLTDVIEYLYKLLVDKNINIKLLNMDNERLNEENLKLNKGNLELCEEVESLKKGVRQKSRDNSTLVNIDNSINNIKTNINTNFMLDYLKEVKQSITSSEFQEGMIIDEFDFEDNLSKRNQI